MDLDQYIKKSNVSLDEDQKIYLKRIEEEERNQMLLNGKRVKLLAKDHFVNNKSRFTIEEDHNEVNDNSKN